MGGPSDGALHAVVRTPRELTVVCDAARVPADVSAERGWRAPEVEGPLDLDLTGVLAAIAGPLARAGVAIFAVSTFDTDYVLVGAERLDVAVAALREAGHTAPEATGTPIVSRPTSPLPPRRSASRRSSRRRRGRPLRPPWRRAPRGA